MPGVLENRQPQDVRWLQARRILWKGGTEKGRLRKKVFKTVASRDNTEYKIL